MNNIENPLLSVIIPSYNHGNYIGRAINSVLDQTYENIEIIIIDNFSNDNTDQVLNEFKDNRIYCKKINNFGVIAMSRNEGIRQANGDWIAFLDSDDWWMKNKLEVCMKFANQDTDLIYHGMHSINKDSLIFKKRKMKTRSLKKPIFVELMVSGNPIINSSVVVRKSLLYEVEMINEDRALVGSEDYNTWLKIAQITNKFKFIPKQLGFYYIHGNAVSRNNVVKSMQYAMSSFLPFLSAEDLVNSEVFKSYVIGRISYLEGDYTNAENRLFFVFKKGNLHLKFKSLLMLCGIYLARNFNQIHY